MMFAFLVSILGFTLAIRISDRLIARDLFSKNEMTKIGTAYFAAVMILFLLLPRTRLMLWISLHAPLAAISLALFALVKHRARVFRERFREALTLVLLKMKSGKSYRHSLAEVIVESDARTRAKLSEINSVVAFSQQKRDRLGDKFINEVIDELAKADQSPHSAGRRLTLFRDKIRLEDDFRRRSGQVMARIRAQSFVMSGIYLAVLAFVSAKFGWSSNARVIAGSMLLFALGAAWIWWGGRKLRWKV